MRKLEILIADDHELFRRSLRSLVESRPGWHVCGEAADGKEAVEKAKELKPDVVLLDVSMPEMNGLDAARLIKKHRPESNILIVSQNEAELMRKTAHDIGVNGFIHKSNISRELFKQLESASRNGSESDAGGKSTWARLVGAKAWTAAEQRRLLAESELERVRLHELFLQVPAAICLLHGPEHRYTFVNTEYLKITGRAQPQDFLGQTVREALPEFEGQPFFDLLDKVFRTGVPYVGSESKVGLNGHEAYHNFVYEPLRDPSGAVEGILVHVVDVTEQVQTRKTIEERERQFRDIIDHLPAAIYTTDAEGRLTHFNPAAIEFSGRVPQLGTDQWCVSWKIFRPDGTPLPHDECPMAIALKEGRILEGVEAIAERPDGSRRWFVPYPTPLRDDRGKIIGGVNMLVDITERKEAERATSLLAAIVDSSDDAIVSKKLDGTITSWNKAAERVFGYAADEAIGKHITLIIPRDRWSEEDSILAKLRRGDRIDHFETVRMRKDGSMVDLAVTISPVRDAAGRVIGASKVARDISERKRAELALADAARRQKALFHLADELHRSTSLDEVYAAALNAICSAFKCERASILLYDDSGTMRFVDWRGISEQYRRAAAGYSPWRRDEPDPHPVCVESVERGDFDDSFKSALTSEGIQALAFVPLVSNGRLMGRFMAYFPESHVFEGDELSLSLTIARQLAFAIERKRGDEALRRSEEEFRRISETLDAEVRSRTRELESRNADVLRQSELLRDLSRRLLQAQDEERRRIARELHDSAGQTLTVLGMCLARVSQQQVSRNAPAATNILNEAEQLVQQLHQEIRTMSYLLHPPLLDETGLGPALTWYVEGLRSRSGIEISLAVPQDLERLPRDMELVAFRVVQESLTNIHRHSGSKTAAIAITRRPDALTIEIRDRGKGMPPQKLAEIQSRGGGVGIRGIRERVQQLDGDMSIESSKSGTRVFVTIPLPKMNSVEQQNRRDVLQAAV